MKSDNNELLFLKFEDLVQVWFQKDTNVTASEFNNEWIDPYDSIWLKLLSVILYAIEIFASLVMMTFVNYESAGYFGHYRTLINQLLSHLYGGVSIFLRLKCMDPATHCAPCKLFHVTLNKDIWIENTIVNSQLINKNDQKLLKYFMIFFRQLFMVFLCVDYEICE